MGLSFTGFRAKFKTVAISIAACSFVLTTPVFAYDGKPQPLTASEKPDDFSGIGITEKLSTQLDMSLPFINEKGETVTLGSFYDGKSPVILSLIYFSCPSLCNLHLNGLIEGLKEVDWNAGEKYQVLAISFDSKESSDVAAGKKASYMKLYDRAGTENGFHFLTASEDTVKKITEATGFSYKWNEQAQEWAHASAAIVTTPKGVIARYLHGIMFEGKNLRLALSEATEGKIGTVIDQLMWYCFKYDPAKNTYALYAFRLVQIAALLTVLVLALILIPFWLRSRKQKKS